MVRKKKLLFNSYSKGFIIYYDNNDSASKSCIIVPLSPEEPPTEDKMFSCSCNKIILEVHNCLSTWFDGVLFQEGKLHPSDDNHQH